jgi:hypothetical protein
MHRNAIRIFIQILVYLYLNYIFIYDGTTIQEFEFYVF